MLEKTPSVSSSSQYILWFQVILLICALLEHGSASYDFGKPII